MSEIGVAQAAELPLPPSPAQVGEGRSRVWLERSDVSSRLRREGPLLVLALAVIGTSLILTALKSRNLWFGVPCLFKTITGAPCLACGLTRSFVLTAHGHLAGAFEMHLLGPVLFMMTVGAAVYLSVALVTGYRVRVSLAPLTRRLAAWSVLSVFLACWFVKLVFMRGTW
jgi:hypothetical protein